MIAKKISQGYVIQLLDTSTGKFISQEFISGDVDYEDEAGNSISFDAVLKQLPTDLEPYLPFDMVQPTFYKKEDTRGVGMPTAPPSWNDSTLIERQRWLDDGGK